jgi:quercetin dioxygenase-like cupin family protein
MRAKAVIRMPGEGKEVTLAGQPMAFLVTGEDSKHTCMFEFTMPPAFSTGLHVHRVQEETFYVLEGECEWQVGDQLILAKPGTFLFIPPGVPHNIGNASDKPARMFLTVSGLTNDDNSIWRGKATKAGTPVNVALDYQGNIVPSR